MTLAVETKVVVIDGVKVTLRAYRGFRCKRIELHAAGEEAHLKIDAAKPGAVAA